jgi:casein kinase 1
MPQTQQEVRHGQVTPAATRQNQHLSASRLNAPQPPPPSPALVRHGSKRHERRHASGAARDPRRQSSGQHLSQPSTPGTSAHQLPSQGQIRMSQTPLQASQLATGAQVRGSPDRKKKGFFASLMGCCGGCISNSLI